MKHQKNEKASQVEQFKKIPCHYHPQEFLKYFCKKSKCIQPLCKICLDIHIDEHDIKGDTKDIVLYEKCQFEVIKRMTEDKYELQEQIYAFNNQIEKIINFQCEQNWLSLIEQAEKQVLGVVESYFSNLKSFLFSSSPQLQKLQLAQSKLNQFSLRLNQLQEEITTLSTDQSVQQLIYYYQGDVDKVNNIFKAQLNDVQTELSSIDFHQMNIPKFLIDPIKINDLMTVLYEYAQFEIEKSVNRDQQNEENEEVYEEENAEEENAEEEIDNELIDQEEIEEQDFQDDENDQLNY